jgi:hypothetical protein
MTYALWLYLWMMRYCPKSGAVVAWKCLVPDSEEIQASIQQSGHCSYHPTCP